MRAGSGWADLRQEEDPTGLRPSARRRRPAEGSTHGTRIPCTPTLLATAAP